MNIGGRINHEGVSEPGDIVHNGRKRIVWLQAVRGSESAKTFPLRLLLHNGSVLG